MGTYYLGVRPLSISAWALWASHREVEEPAKRPRRPPYVGLLEVEPPDADHRERQVVGVQRVRLRDPAGGSRFT